MVASVILLLLAFACISQALMLSRAILHSHLALRPSTLLRMSTPSPDPMDAIRAKMNADPNYDPMQDPEAAKLLESMIPDELREAGNSIAKLKVALKNTSEGVNAIKDLGNRAATFDKKSLISSPTSDWFKEGMPEVKVNVEAKEKALQELKSKYPDVPAV